MLDHSQLQLALRDMSRGAAAILHVGRASDVAPKVQVSSTFTRQALLAPLARLALAFGGDLPKHRPRRERRRRKARRGAPEVVMKGRLPAPAKLDNFEEVSSWDPDERPYSPDADPLLESGNCRALLLEIVRRAAYDWVLYRMSSKLHMRVLADSAFQWLFVEHPDSALWEQREDAGKELTGFVSICEMLELDPDRVRARIRMLTERDIMGAGRPAEKRKHKVNDEMMQADDMSVFDVNLDSIPTYDPMFASSEG